MKRFILVDYLGAVAAKYPEVEPDGYDLEYRICLYETDGEKPIRLVAVDGGEPEDQTFGRNWNWVLGELNKLAEEKVND